MQRVVHTFTFIVDITGQLMHFLCFNRLFLLSCSSSFLGLHWCNNIIITLPNERLIYSVSTNGGQVGKEAASSVRNRIPFPRVDWHKLTEITRCVLLFFRAMLYVVSRNGSFAPNCAVSVVVSRHVCWAKGIGSPLVVN